MQKDYLHVNDAIMLNDETGKILSGWGELPGLRRINVNYICRLGEMTGSGNREVVEGGGQVWSKPVI